MVALNRGAGEVMIGFGVNFEVSQQDFLLDRMYERKELRMTARFGPWKPLEG